MASFITNENLNITKIIDSYFEDQYKSKQDIVFPPIIINANHRAYLFFDGHGNDDCINVIKCLDHNKLKNLLAESTNSCMEYIKNLTNVCHGGAMISIVEVINDKIPNIKITWMGDALVYVYKDNEIIGNSYAHNIIDNPDSMLDNFILKRPEISCEPLEDGITQKLLYENDVNPYYKIIIPYDNKIYGGEEHTVATTRTLGHRGFFIGDKISEIIINLNEPGEYKIIGGSDGIWDIMNPKDKFLYNKTNARNIVKECRIRWRKEWILPNYRKEITNPNSDFWTEDTMSSMGDQDDICCICSIITVS